MFSSSRFWSCGNARILFGMPVGVELPTRRSPQINNRLELQCFKLRRSRSRGILSCCIGMRDQSDGWSSFLTDVSEINIYSKSSGLEMRNARFCFDVAVGVCAECKKKGLALICPATCNVRNDRELTSSIGSMSSASQNISLHRAACPCVHHRQLSALHIAVG